MTIAIMSAMHEENASLIDAMHVDKKEEAGSRTYYTGHLYGREVVVVFSHWGKVAAAITATTLVCRFNAQEIVFTGVAGALTSDLSVGDIVVGKELYQHDMDVRPIIDRHEIPLLGRAGINASPALQENLLQACKQFVSDDYAEIIDADTARTFGITSPSVVAADIASGDQFVFDAAVAADIKKRLPTVACVEMEGAAVAQVCESFGVPFGLVRTISDGANENSQWDFQSFIEQIARAYSLGIIKRYLGG